MSNGMIANPSKYQTAIFNAFLHTDESIACNAVAGSGKTSTVVHLANLLQGNDVYNAIFTCFNVAIREELSKRLPNGFNVANFHRIGKQIIEDNFRVRTHKNWVNKWKYKDLVSDVMLEKGYTPDENYPEYQAVESAVGKCQLSCVDPVTDRDGFLDTCDAFDITPFPGMDSIVSEVLRRGISMARSGQCIDFNDMVWLPSVCTMKTRTYKYVFVDEAQDLNVAQRNLVLMLGDSHTRYVVVGDPYQAIYGFAGADCHSFENVVQATKAKEYPLSVCYRCPKNIVINAQSIVPHLEYHDGQKDGTIENLPYADMLKRVNSKTGDMVISRTTAPIVTLAFELLALGVPAKIKGRDIMANIVSTVAAICKGSKGCWPEFESKLQLWASKEYTRISKRKHAEMQLASLEDKVEAITVIYRKSLTAGITDLNGFKTWLESLYSEDIHGAVTLSTIHKVKGLEAENIFILDPSKMPHPMAKTDEQKQQELNLKYVAFTRAQSCLYMVSAKPKNSGSDSEGSFLMTQKAIADEDSAETELPVKHVRLAY